MIIVMISAGRSGKFVEADDEARGSRLGSIGEVRATSGGQRKPGTCDVDFSCGSPPRLGSQQGSVSAVGLAACCRQRIEKVWRRVLVIALLKDAGRTSSCFLQLAAFHYGGSTALLVADRGSSSHDTAETGAEERGSDRSTAFSDHAHSIRGHTGRTLRVPPLVQGLQISELP